MATNAQILDELGAFLKENYPPLGKVNSVFTLGTAERNKLLQSKIKQFTEKARIILEWRVHLAERLNLSEDEVLRATNTIVNMIENALVNGGIVRLRNFGDFVSVDTNRGETTFRNFYFKPDQAWVKLINEPLLTSDLGLKRKVSSGKLARRITDEPAVPAPVKRTYVRKES